MNAYSNDVLAWSERQGDLLRRRAAGDLVNDSELDWPNIAEEIQSLGQSERYRIRNHIFAVIEHLIKLQASPATEPRNGWKTSVRNARRGIERCLKTSPSLRREIAGMILDETSGAKQDVAATLQDYGSKRWCPLRPWLLPMRGYWDRGCRTIPRHSRFSGPRDQRRVPVCPCVGSGRDGCATAAIRGWAVEPFTKQDCAARVG